MHHEQCGKEEDKMVSKGIGKGEERVKGKAGGEGEGGEGKGGRSNRTRERRGKKAGGRARMGC